MFSEDSDVLVAFARNMDVFQTDWKERHEQRGSSKPPTLLDVWQGYLGDEEESAVLEKINVPTIFHPDQGLFNVKRVPERGAELKNIRDIRKSNPCPNVSRPALKDAGKAADSTGTGSGMGGVVSQGLSQGVERLGNVFGNVFTKKEVIVPDTGGDPFDQILAERETEKKSKHFEREKHQGAAAAASYEYDFKHPPIVEAPESQEQAEEEDCAELDGEEAATPQNNLAELEDALGGVDTPSQVEQTQYIFEKRPEEIMKLGIKLRDESMSDESGILSTTPSTSSRSKPNVLSKIAGFMKRPKRRRLRKCSFEGTSGEDSATSNSLNLYFDHRPSPNSSLTLSTESNHKVISNSASPMSDPSSKLNSSKNKISRSRQITQNKAPLSPVGSVHTKRRSKADIPTEDYVLSDPEPDVNSPTQSRHENKLILVSHHPSCKTPGTITTARTSRRVTAAASASPPKIRKRLTVKIPAERPDSPREVETPVGRMLDNRGRCYRFPIPGKCPGSDFFDFSDEESSGISEGGGHSTSNTTSHGRRESTTSEGSLNSLPSLANFSKLCRVSNHVHGSRSADMLRDRDNQTPIGRESREKSRSTSDILKDRPLSASSSSFNIIRSPTKLTPPPIRNNNIGHFFCLPSCLAPFDRAMFVD